MLVEGKRRNVAKAILSTIHSGKLSILCYFFTNCFASFLVFFGLLILFPDFKDWNKIRFMENLIRLCCLKHEIHLFQLIREVALQNSFFLFIWVRVWLRAGQFFPLLFYALPLKKLCLFNIFPCLKNRRGHNRVLYFFFKGFSRSDNHELR